MSLVTELFAWLVIETILGFTFYATGCLILKIITFGGYNVEFKDYGSFKADKSKKVMLLGFTFYVLCIALIVSLLK